MAGKVLFSGGRIDSVNIISGNPYDFVGGGYNSAFADSCIRFSNAKFGNLFYDPAAAPLLSPYTSPAGNTIYFHMEYEYGDGGGPGGELITLLDSTGEPWVRLTGDFDLQYNSGTGSAPIWTTIGTTANTYNLLTAIDLVVVMATSGPHTASLILNGTQYIAPANFTCSGLTAAGLGQWTINGGAPQLFGSEIMVTENISTVGAHVKTSRGTAAGTYTAWAGTVADVNQPVNSEGAFNQALTAGLKQSYDMSAITVPAGYEIASMFYWLTAKNAGSGSPANIEAICRPNTTDHISGDLNGMGVAFNSVGAQYPVNPDTSQPWNQTAWNIPTQMGYESAA